LSILQWRGELREPLHAKQLNAGPAGSIVAFEDVAAENINHGSDRVALNFRLSRPNLLGYFQKPLKATK